MPKVKHVQPAADIYKTINNVIMGGLAVWQFSIVTTMWRYYINAMTGITNELICEMLKSLHTGQADIKLTLSDHTRQLSRVRAELNSLHGQIAALRDGDPHREIIQAQIDNRLERIDARLDSTDA